MANLSITELKKGTIFQLDKTPYKVIDYGQKVMGRGGSIVNVKIKSLLDGKVLAKTFKGNDSVRSAEITNHTAQYLYSENKTYFFMDQATYENYELSYSLVEDQVPYLKEGMELTVQTFGGNVINVELPKNLYMKIIYAEDAVKGDTSSAITKDAKTETGLNIKVPPFIKTGDIVSVDTTTGKYRERKKA